MVPVLWALALALFGCNAAEGASLTLPPAFASNQKISTLRNPSIDQISAVLSKFEIDSHIEVVLVGSSFTTNEINTLSDLLEVASAQSVLHSPLRFVHEKLVFHVSVSQTLHTSIHSIIDKSPNGDVDPQEITKVLHEFHSRGATHTTLFLLAYPDRSVEGYSYRSPLMACARRSFIAEHGFAWLDLTADATPVLPTSSGVRAIVPEPVSTINYLTSSGAVSLSSSSSSSSSSGGGNQISKQDIKNSSSLSVISLAAVDDRLPKLVSLIRRSGEALVPFPVTQPLGGGGGGEEDNEADSARDSFDDLSMVFSWNQPKAVKSFHILAVTICVDVVKPGVPCSADTVTLAAADRIIQAYGSDSGNDSSDNYNSKSFYKVSRSHASFSMMNTQIAHAIHASTHYAKDTHSAHLLSSRQLQHWLGSSQIIKDTVRKALEKEAKSQFGEGSGSGGSGSSGGGYFRKDDEVDMIVVPVFTLQVSGDMDIFLDDYKLTKTVIMDEPSGGWNAGIQGLEDDDFVIPERWWPTHAVISIRHPYNNQKMTVGSGLSCNGMPIPTTELFASDDVKGKKVSSSSSSSSASFDQVFQALVHCMWGVGPPSVHFSATSPSGLVMDYLWDTPSLLRPPPVPAPATSINQVVTFRELRSVPRLRLFNHADYLLQRLTATIEAASQLVPPVNMTELLELTLDNNPMSGGGGGAAAATSATTSATTSAKTFHSVVSRSDAKISAVNDPAGAAAGKNVAGMMKKKKKVGIFESTLQLFDEASTAISHVEYGQAHEKLLAAHNRLMVLGRRVDSIVAVRLGQVTCEEHRPPVTPGKPTTSAPVSSSSSKSIDGDGEGGGGGGEEEEGLSFRQRVTRGIEEVRKGEKRGWKTQLRDLLLVLGAVLGVWLGFKSATRVKPGPLKY